MSLALTMPKDRNSVVERAKAERRHFVRVRLDLAGRFFLPSDNREAECKIVDLSPGGAQITSEIVPSDDAPIILYVDGFGRLEGNVARPTEGGGFSVNFHCSAAKRDKIAEQLTLYMNRDVVDESHGARARSRRIRVLPASPVRTAKSSVAKCLTCRSVAYR